MCNLVSLPQQPYIQSFSTTTVLLTSSDQMLRAYRSLVRLVQRPNSWHHLITLAHIVECGIRVQDEYQTPCYRNQNGEKPLRIQKIKQALATFSQTPWQTFSPPPWPTFSQTPWPTFSSITLFQTGYRIQWPLIVFHYPLHFFHGSISFMTCEIHTDSSQKSWNR